MDNMNISQEEMQKMIEKAQKDLEETLAKMTPEERAAAEARAQKLIEEDAIKMQQIIDEAKAVMSQTEKEAPKFCPNCGAKTDGGNFCSFCGSKLK